MREMPRSRHRGVAERRPSGAARQQVERDDGGCGRAVDDTSGAAYNTIDSRSGDGVRREPPPWGG
jgi:hypothetical protein